MLRRTADLGTAPQHIAHALLRSGLSIPELRALSPLSVDAQRIIDQAVVNVGLDRLVVAADLLGSGLVTPLSDPLSVMEVQWEKVGRSGGAQRTMNPSARGENQLPKRSFERIPVYLTTDDFSVGIRTLRMSQRIGQPLDTTQVEQSTRNVNEAIEDAAINGTDVQVDGYDTPGLLNAPNANDFQYGTNGGWDALAKTGQNILDDFLGLIDTLQAVRRFGPYTLALPTTYGNKLNQNFVANYPTTIRQRLEAVETGGGQRVKIIVADQMPAGKVVMYQRTKDVVDIIDGQAPTVIPWTSVDGFTLYWMVMAIQIPRVRDDYDGKSGIVVGHV